MIVTSPSLLRLHIKMSLDKAVPTLLRHNEVERGGYGQNAPIRYAPEQELSSDVSDVTNSIQLKGPGKTKTYLKVVMSLFWTFS
jgi:hypothetical protein